jgi:uncharacterized protein (TIGR02246 family)
VTTANRIPPAVAQALQGFITAWNRHQAGEMAAFFAPEGDLLNMHGRYVRGRRAVARLLAHEHRRELGLTTARFHGARLRRVTPALLLLDLRMTLRRGSRRQVLRVVLLLRREPAGWRFLAARPAPSSDRA